MKYPLLTMVSALTKYMPTKYLRYSNDCIHGILTMVLVLDCPFAGRLYIITAAKYMHVQLPGEERHLSSNCLITTMTTTIRVGVHASFPVISNSYQPYNYV